MWANASVAEYFSHIAKLNQLLVLSQQLEEDIRHLGSHKYIAHQLSVIYVSNYMCQLFAYTLISSFLSCINILYMFLFYFAASHQLLQRNSGLLWYKERYWSQLQTDETVSSDRGRLQAWTSAGCSLHQLVSENPNVMLAEMIMNAVAIWKQQPHAVLYVGY